MGALGEKYLKDNGMRKYARFGATNPHLCVLTLRILRCWFFQRQAAARPCAGAPDGALAKSKTRPPKSLFSSKICLPTPKMLSPRV